MPQCKTFSFKNLMYSTSTFWRDDNDILEDDLDDFIEASTHLPKFTKYFP